MNNSVRIFFALALTAGLMLSSCSSSDEESAYEFDTSDYSSVAVRGFALQPNAKVLNNLDSVFFSIDLNTARIFNADSLPYGTDVSALAVSITTDACSALTIYATDSEGGEKEIDYINEDDAKINFAAGDVKMHIVSADGEHARDYFIKVNVHKVVPDSLYWSELACTALPTSFRNPTGQKAVRFADKAYCLSTDGSSYCMATSTDIFDNRWNTSAVTFPAAVDVRSFTATDNALFILAADGRLLTSADGSVWSYTGEVWRGIVAPYGQQLLGLVVDGGKYYHVAYPGGNRTAAAADFPVTGISAPLAFTTKWAADSQIMIAGGRKADGGLTGATWAYDGNAWALIGESLPAAESYSVTECLISETDIVSWRMKTSEVLLAFGGRNRAGVAGRDVYLSRDMGITWKKGDSYLQLPEYMPAVSEADILTFPKTMSADAAAGTLAAATSWVEMPVRRIPLAGISAGLHSRAVSQTEEWECPFLYMFGGRLDDGSLQPKVWRGVVNHFTFRPLE